MIRHPELKAFCRQMHASPNDDHVRGVFADWLEETEQPRYVRAAGIIRDCINTRIAVREHFTNRLPLPDFVARPGRGETLVIQVWRRCLMALGISAELRIEHLHYRFGVGLGGAIPPETVRMHETQNARRAQTLRFLHYCELHAYGLWPQVAIRRWRGVYDQIAPDARYDFFSLRAPLAPQAVRYVLNSHWANADDALFLCVMQRYVPRFTEQLVNFLNSLRSGANCSICRMRLYDVFRPTPAVLPSTQPCLSAP